MSKLWSTSAKVPVCLTASDLHLRTTAPVARKEKDWFGVMEWYLAQLKGIWVDLSQDAGKEIPIVYAGDIFHKWNNPSELVNFAIRHLPPGFAIPGQHDLPNHRYEDIRKTSYYTLVHAGVIHDLEQGVQTTLPEHNLILCPFPWTYKVEPLSVAYKVGKYKSMFKVAVIHQYLWKSPDTSYVGAKKEEHLQVVKRRLKCYDFAVFGDNHIGFTAQTIDGCQVVNNGGFMCWRSDERDYTPHVSVLYSDGSLERIALDTSKDEWHDPKEVKGLEESFETVESFLEELNRLGDKAIDFARVLRIKAANLPPEKERVRNIILKALEQSDGI